MNYKGHKITLKAHYEGELDGLKRDKAYWQLEAQAKYARITALEEALREIHAWTAFNTSPSAEEIAKMRGSISSLLSKETKE